MACRKGTALGPDGVPCEYLLALGKRCILVLAEAMTKWNADLGNMTLPTVLQISRLERPAGDGPRVQRRCT